MTQIVYLHGFASSPSSKKARYFQERLEAAGARIEIPDLAAGDFEHLTLTSQLARIQQAAGEGPAALLGSSMGGYLAALYAARHPEISQIALLAPAFGFAQRWRDRLGEAASEEWRTSGVIEVFHYGDNRLRSLRYDLLSDADRYEDFPDFHQPALIFHGARDDVVPARFSRQFAAGRPNVRLEVVDSGHDLLNMLDYMAPRLISFLLGRTTV